MALTIALDQARPACEESVHRFLAAVDGFTEYELLGASRCHGWARLEVVAHVLAGWQEMLAGLVSPVDQDATVDAESYWSAFEAQYADEDPIAVLMSQRRRSAVFARPASACEQLADVGAALLRGIRSLPDRTCLWQGHVFTAGDFLTVWAVEDVVHQLDLDSEVPPQAEGLALARTTVEARIGQSLPADWDDERAVLIGTGRVPVPEGHAELTDRLPALG